jgi:hypothetical protein
VRNGRANAASGRIMVNVPNDHFGPILHEHDPTTGKVSWMFFLLFAVEGVSCSVT